METLTKYSSEIINLYETFIPADKSHQFSHANTICIMNIQTMRYPKFNQIKIKRSIRIEVKLYDL